MREVLVVEIESIHYSVVRMLLLCVFFYLCSIENFLQSAHRGRKRQSG